MADITNELSNIKNAVLGRDVRSSIHDGIYAINKEVESTTQKQSDLNDKQDALNETFKNLVINAGNSNAEVAASRGSYDYLPDRLAAVDEQFNTIKNKLSNNEPVVSFIFDDARQSVYDKALPIFQNYNKTASVALITENLEVSVNLAMTTNNVLDLVNAGWDMMCHGYKSTQLTDSTTNDVAIREITYAKEIANKYGVELNGYVAPYGVTPQKFLPLIKQNFKYGYCNYESGLMDYSKDLYTINRYSLENKTKSQIDEKINECLTSKGFLTFYCHEILDDTSVGNSATMIEYIITKCNELGIKVMNVKDAMNYLFSKQNDNKILKTKEIQYELVDDTKTLKWQKTQSSSSNVTWTCNKNLQSRVDVSFANSPFNAYAVLWNDINFDSSVGNTYACLEIPIAVLGNARAELRIEPFKDTVSLGIINIHKISNFKDKDLLKTYFYIPKNLDANKLRLRIQMINTVANGTCAFKIFDAKLSLYSEL